MYTTVMPSLLSRRMILNRRSLSVAVSELVGSSMIISEALFDRALRISTVCRWAIGSLSMMSVALSSKPYVLIISCAIAFIFLMSMNGKPDISGSLVRKMFCATLMP